MKFSCPKCHTSYTASDDKLPVGVDLKMTCKSCGANIRLHRKAPAKKASLPAPHTLDEAENLAATQIVTGAELAKALGKIQAPPRGAKVPAPVESPDDDAGTFGEEVETQIVDARTMRQLMQLRDADATVQPASGGEAKKDEPSEGGATRVVDAKDMSSLRSQSIVAKARGGASAWAKSGSNDVPVSIAAAEAQEDVADSQEEVETQISHDTIRRQQQRLMRRVWIAAAALVLVGGLIATVMILQHGGAVVATPLPHPSQPHVATVPAPNGEAGTGSTGADNSAPHPDSAEAAAPVAAPAPTPRPALAARWKKSAKGVIAKGKIKGKAVTKPTEPAAAAPAQGDANANPPATGTAEPAAPGAAAPADGAQPAPAP